MRIRRIAGVGIFIGFLMFFFFASAELSTNLQIRKDMNPNNKKLVSSKTYVDKDGNPVIPEDKGYSTIRYTYGTDSLVVKTEYLDLEGKLVNNNDGYAIKKCTYSKKKLTKTEYFDAKNKPVIGPEGFHRKETKYWYKKHQSTWEYDTEGKPINLHRITEFGDKERPSLVTADGWYDAEGNPAAGPEGYARVEYGYRKSRLLKTTFLDTEGNLYYNAKQKYAVKELVLQDGRAHELNYYGADGELCAGPDGYAKAVYSYINYNSKIRRTMFYNADGTLYYTKKGYCGIQQSFTVKGVVTDESYFVGEDQRGYSTDGYSRVVKKLNRKGKVGYQTYYDAEDNMMVPEKIGYAMVRNIYTNNHKVLYHTEYYNEKEEPMLGPDGYFAVNYKLEKSAVIQASFYDTDGETLINTKNGYAKIVYINNENKLHTSAKYYDMYNNPVIVRDNADEIRFEYNENKKKISESYWAHNEPVENDKGFHEIRYEYTGGDNISEQIYLDKNGNVVTTPEGYAWSEKLYNSQGKEMATLYYDANGSLMQTPGKEYAYVRTITATEKILLGEMDGIIPETINDLEAEEAGEADDEDEEEDFTEEPEETSKAKESEDGEEDEAGEEPESEESRSDLVYVEYYGTNGELMNLSSGYAVIVKTVDEAGRTTEQGYYDKDGQKVLLADGYHSYRVVYGKDGFAASTAYYGLNGEPVINNNKKVGYHRIERTYWNKNHYTSEAWFDADGAPMTNGDTYVRVEREFDKNGNTIRAVTFGADGNKIARKDGYDEIRQEFNTVNKVIRIEYYLDGELVPLKDGYAIITREYDEAGNLTSERYYDEDEMKTLLPDGYHYYVKVFGEDGFAASTAYYGISGEPVINTNKKIGYHRIERTYWNKDHYTSEAWFGADGTPMTMGDTYVRVEREFDENGNAVHELLYGADGNKIACKAGYDEVRREFDEHGQTSESYWLDGEAVLRDKGYHEVWTEYNDHGQVIAKSYFDVNGGLIALADGYAMVEQTWGENGLVASVAYYGTMGEPVVNTNKKVGYHRIEYTYDEKGNKVGEECFDVDGNLIER